MRKTDLMLLLLISIVTFSSCKDDNKHRNLGFQDLPFPSQEFLRIYFPNQKISRVTFNPLFETDAQLAEERSGYIYVSLERDIDLVFSYQNGDWITVSAAEGIPLSATKLLDDDVYRRLTEKEPRAKITMLSALFRHSIKITLDNGTQYAQTQLLAYSGTTLAEVTDINSHQTNKILAFLNRIQLPIENLIGSFFKITEIEGTAYRLFLGDAMTISFNENTDWIHAEIIDPFAANSGILETLLSRIAENEIPISVSNVLQNQYDLRGLQIMVSYGGGNYGFRFQNKDLLINENTGIVPPPISTANRIISTYYDNSYKQVYPNGMTFVGAYDFHSTFLYDTQNRSVVVEVDMNGNWTDIQASRLENLFWRPFILPSRIVEELPLATQNYLKEHYTNRDIYILRHNLRQLKGYAVSVDNRYVLYFNEEGSYINRIEFGEEF